MLCSTQLCYLVYVQVLSTLQQTAQCHSLLIGSSFCLRSMITLISIWRKVAAIGEGDAGWPYFIHPWTIQGDGHALIAANHFCCRSILMYWRSTATFYLLDSAHGANADVALALARRLGPALG